MPYIDIEGTNDTTIEVDAYEDFSPALQVEVFNEHESVSVFLDSEGAKALLEFLQENITTK